MEIPIRLIIGILGVYGCAMIGAHRSGLNVAIVAMVKSKAEQQFNSSDSCIETKDLRYYKSDSANDDGFDWSESTISVILGGSYYVYVFIPIFAGRFAEMYGAKWLLTFGTLIPAILTALTPLAAEFHYSVVIVIRVLIGLCNGCIFPSFFALYSNWFPKSEKAIASAGLMLGHTLGLMFMFLASGYLSDSDFISGWPSVFYVTAIINVPWVILWLIYGADSPSESKRISKKELEYILSNCGTSGGPKRSVSAPWRSIITSRPVWASIIGKSTSSFVYFLLLSNTAFYLDRVFALHISNNGLYNFFAYLANGVGLMTGGPLSNYIRQKNLISLTRLRKNFAHFSYIIPSICILIIPALGCNHILIIVLIVIGMCSYGLMTGGEWPIIGEFAPDFSGTIFGIANAFSTSMGFIAPLIVGAIIENNPSDRYNWNTAFYMTGGIGLFGAIFFELFTTAEPQSWGVVSNKPDVEIECVDKSDIKSDKHNQNVPKDDNSLTQFVTEKSKIVSEF